MPINISTRHGNLEEDRPLLIDVMSRNLPRRTDAQVFNWLYRDNPAGKADVWLALESKEKATVGIAAAFPRRIYIDNSDAFAWVLGDFCLDAQYRSLGPALHLQRACLGVTAAKGGMFCYDFPSAGMLAVYKRLGFEITGKMLRLAKLLRVDRKVRDLVKPRLARVAMAAVGNTAITLTASNAPNDGSLEVALYQRPCTEEFSTLARDQRGRFGIHVDRTAEYLNWRYVDNPLTPCEFVTARRQGVLRGYAVWSQAGEDAYLLDLFGENDPIVVKTLLAGAVAMLTKRGVMTLSVWLNESHPWLSWYSEMGFRVRDSAPLICVSSPSLGKTADFITKNLFLMQGDRDS